MNTDDVTTLTKTYAVVKIISLFRIQTLRIDVVNLDGAYPSTHLTSVLVSDSTSLRPLSESVLFKRFQCNLFPLDQAVVSYLVLRHDPCVLACC